MPTPISHKLDIFAKAMLTSGTDFPLCLVGDSRITDGSTYANLGYGIRRTWKPWRYTGVGGRALHGPAAWAFGGTTDVSTLCVGSITAISVAAQAVVTSATHGLQSGDSITISSTNSTPNINGTYTVGANPLTEIVVLTTDTFSVPVTTTGSGTTGTFTGGTAGTSGARGLAYGYGAIPPGGVIAGGQTKISPNQFRQKHWIGNISNSVALLRIDLNDNSNCAIPDWASGNNVFSRLVYYRDNTDAGMVGGIGVIARRNSTTTGSATDFNPAGGAPGITYVEKDCGSAANSNPGIELRTDAASTNETGKHFYSLGACIYRDDGAGARLPGMMMADIATGGYTTVDLLRAIGGDGGNATCTTANCVAWLQAMMPAATGGVAGPSFWLLSVINLTATESSELSTGVETEQRANYRNICDQIELVHRTLGKPGLPIILIDAPYLANGGNATTAATRAAAAFRISQERSNVCFFNSYVAMAGDSASTNPWFTADGTHPSGNNSSPSGNGAEAWAQSIHIALQTADDVRRRVLPRNSRFNRYVRPGGVLGT